MNKELSINDARYLYNTGGIEKGNYHITFNDGLSVWMTDEELIQCIKILTESEQHIINEILWKKEG